MAKRYISVGVLSLPGILSAPPAPKGIVIFVHGSGSSRLSPRNVYAADYFNTLGFATLLFDLLTPVESQDRRNVFNIALLSDRVVDAITLIQAEENPERLPIGLFGASTGAAAAIATAVKIKGIAAIVSRGGRPDLAEDALPKLAQPTLLIVGSEDRDVIALNKAAQKRMQCESQLHIVPGAGHLFEEPGTLDEALRTAGAWFTTYLQGSR